MPSRLRSLLQLAGHLCRLGLAALFLYAGALKSLDPEGFAHEVAQYGILPGGATRLAAYLLVPFEVALGASLLLNFRPVLSLALAAGLMLMFIGAVGYAIATDQPLTECGCFGRNVPRTPAETLREDLVFLAGAAVGLVGAWLPRGGGGPGRPAGGRWKAPAVAAVAVATGAFVVASPSLPIDDLATVLKPGVAWADLGVALADADLARGGHLVAIMGMKDDATAASLDRMNKLAASGKIPVLGLYADDDAAYNEFFWTRGPAFPLYHVAPSDLRRLHRKLPRFFAVKDGRITATWPAPPTESQAAEALGLQST